MKWKSLFLLGFVAFFACDQYSSAPILTETFNRDARKVIAYLNEKEEDGVRTDDLYFKRAEAYLDLDSSWKALSDIDTALLKGSTNAEYHFLKGRILERINRKQEAINELLVAEKLGLTNYELYSSLTELYLKNEEYDKALSVADRMLNLQNTEQGHLLKAEVYLSRNDTTRAIRSYETALASDSDFPEAGLSLARLRLAKKQYNAANKIMDRFLKQSRPNTEFKLLKADYYLEREAYDSAKTTFRMIYEEDTTDLSIINSLIRADYALGNYDTAQLWVNKSLQLDSTQLQIKLMNARTLDQLQNYEAARLQYENILEMDSTVQIAREELDILNRKVAYLWRIEERRRRQDSLISNPPPVIRKKQIE